ncbi:HEAT repeat domain-containing protein [Corynebacterium deserti]|uniref:HEAT repeat domain-containing protein n=1 Tax=Corynebacterium deserti TaxID=1408191 RepID=UPI0018D077DC|nr:HEAT repeat domain-containing protein [Corynebacterium deserti]
MHLPKEWGRGEAEIQRGLSREPVTLAESALIEVHINAEGALAWALVARGLVSKDPAVRFRAARIVAGAGDPQVAELLVPLLADDFAGVRAEAALALARFSAPEQCRSSSGWL